MATVVVMGAGIGGITQAYELRKAIGRDHRIVVVNDSDRFEFTPSNPWVAVGWRKEEQIVIDLPKLMERFGLEFDGQGVRRLHPEVSELEMDDGSRLAYDYLVIATGPKLAFEEVDGLGPNNGHTQSICKTGHAIGSFAEFEKLVASPGPVVARRIVFRPRVRVCVHPRYGTAQAQDTRQGAHAFRDAGTLRRSSRPRWRRRHQGPDGIGVA